LKKQEDHVIVGNNVCAFKINQKSLRKDKNGSVTGNTTKEQREILKSLLPGHVGNIQYVDYVAKHHDVLFNSNPHPPHDIIYYIMDHVGVLLMNNNHILLLRNACHK
jgi:hypothetical protein